MGKAGSSLVIVISIDKGDYFSLSEKGRIRPSYKRG